MMHFFSRNRGHARTTGNNADNLVSIAPKLTQTNKHILLEGIKGASKKEAELLASRVTPDGNVLDQEETVQIAKCRDRTGSGTSWPPQHQQHRPAVPAPIKHTVYLRDHGQCTFRYSNGERCLSKSMLEIDLKKAWRLGGEHNINNLRVLCREHNQLTAQIDLGIRKYTYAKIGWQTPRVA
jgi:5-methylcytosine-specific restriction endonuclease McrA